MTQLKIKTTLWEILMTYNLFEGLRPLDLKGAIRTLFEIDTFASKMGSDRDVCVLSFQAVDRAPAKDLMEFFEKSYNFVLDSDISTGENEIGEYTIFVEISRSPELVDQIEDLVYGVRKLTGLKALEFKYHKDKTIRKFSADTIKEIVPLTPRAYKKRMTLIKTGEIKEFFNKTVMNDLILEGDTITILKPFGQHIQLKIIDENSTQSILETTTGPEVADVDAMSEVFWLTKVLGDYKINKLGENFLFVNNDKAMLLQRI